MCISKCKYLIDPSKFEDIKEINNGGFGIIYRAKYTETGNYIAA